MSVVVQHKASPEPVQVVIDGAVAQAFEQVDARLRRLEARADREEAAWKQLGFAVAAARCDAAAAPQAS